MSNRKIFISSGHSNKKGVDRGSAGNGLIEGEVTVEFRNLLKKELELLGTTPIIDSDDSILAQSLVFFRNKTTSDSIVLDIHTNAASPTATGAEVLIPAVPTLFEISLARELAEDISEVLQIPLRGNHKGNKGVKTELESHHGRLGWMKLTGENILLELFFISNPSDVASYQKNKQILAKSIALTLFKYSIK